eukprot:g4570.t1
MIGTRLRTERGLFQLFDQHRSNARNSRINSSESDALLLRVARGETAERPPVWLMRQAGRYMADFRKFSDKYSFRVRSETPSIAIELSLQPYHSFKTDGVIMFSDILTPLPSIGVEFDVIKGKGPVILNPIRSEEKLKELKQLDDPSEGLGFVGEILSSLRKELEGTRTALLGFVGTPWTLAAYIMEGKATKNCLITKAGSLIRAQIVQLFDSWAHYLSPDQFLEFSLPYVNQIIISLKSQHPQVPIIFHMNGGTGKLESLNNCPADVIGLDWQVAMSNARSIFPHKTFQGNVDPLELFGTEESIKKAVDKCLVGGGGSHHILNLGHGVIQKTPEENVAAGSLNEFEDPLEVENIDREYCNDFVCNSSPLVEETIKVFAVDLQRPGRWTLSRFPENVIYQDAFRSFKGKEKYRRFNWIKDCVTRPKIRVTRLKMNGGDTATVSWSMTGMLYGQSLDVDFTSVLEMNLISGRIIKHQDSWDLKRCSPLAAAAFVASRITWSIGQFQRDRQEQFEEFKEWAGLNDDDSVEYYADPRDPYTFHQADNKLQRDALSYLTFVAVLYLCYKGYETIFQL